MAIIIENIAFARKSNSVSPNPDTYLNNVPTITVNAKKEKGTNSVTLNNRAMDLFGLYQVSDDKIIDRLIVLPYKFQDGTDMAIDATSEPVIKAGKNFYSYKVNQNTMTVTSNQMHKDISQHFELDSLQAAVMIVEAKEGTFIMTPYTPAATHFNEGYDVELTNVKPGSDFDIDKVVAEFADATIPF